MALKDVIGAYGREINANITHGSTTYTSDKIVSVNPHYCGELLTAVMRCMDIELDDVGSDANSFKGERISATISVSANGIAVDKDFGEYFVKEATYNDETNSMTLECYDLMLNAMQPYNPVTDFSEAVTLGSFLQAVCNRINITLQTTTFTNSTVTIDGEKFDSSYTYRDVLTQIAQAAGGTIAIKNNKLYVLYPAASGETITPDNLKSIQIGKQYGPINSVVLARTPQEDNIYKRDETAQEWHEIRIENNQIMDSHREDFKDGLYTALNGLTFYPYVIDSFGIGYMKLCDLFTLETLDGSAYTCLWMASDMMITTGIGETSSCKEPKTGETDYTAASETDRAINKTILRVDKQTQTIEALASKTSVKTSEIDGKIDQLTQQVSVKATPEQVRIQVEEAVSGIDSITTATGYTFDKDGLRISKFGEEMENLLDNTGMYVNRGSDNILTANNEGVTAINLTAKKYLTIGNNSRLEDYGTGRTACFYLGG